MTNPYQANSSGTDPVNCTPTGDTESNGPPVRLFRKRVIPATMSWLIGGLLLVVTPFSDYNNWKYLSFDLDDSLPWFLLRLALHATFPAILVIGISNVLAGKKWIRGQWISAILLNLIPCIVMWLLVVAQVQLRLWAINTN